MKVESNRRSAQLPLPVDNATQYVQTELNVPTNVLYAKRLDEPRMVEIIIHCGMAKTGSTAIQNFLLKNRKKLLDQGILFPLTGRFGEDHNAHKVLSYSACKNPHLLKSMLPLPTYPFDAYAKLLHAEVEYFAPRKVVLSSEMFFNRAFCVDTWTTIKDQLNFGDISLLIILRRQEEHIESVYSQSVTGFNKSTSKPTLIYSELILKSYYDYNDQLNRVAQVFGPSRIFTCWYDEIEKDAVKALSILLEIEPEDFRDNKFRTNTRGSWLYVWGVRHLNKFIPNNSITRSSILRVLSGIDRIIATLHLRAWIDDLFRPYSDEQKIQIADKYRATNEMVDKNFNTKWVEQSALEESPVSNSLSD